MAGEGRENQNEEPKQSQNEGAEPKEPKEPQGAEPKEPQGDDDVKDTHGQPGINKERHDKEVAAMQKRIDELQGKLDDAAKTEKAREDLKREIAEMRESIKEERVSWQLEKAGCRNIKAAKALLDDYEGDVDKLKAECPYLFEAEKPKGSTGGKPGGAVDDDAAELARMRRVAGLKSKE